MTITAQDILQARILIVDDQESNVMLLEEMLKSAGYTHVVSTMDPAAVTGMHRRTPFDLILLDLQMPVMDGFQVMEGLKANAIDDYIPVLVITAQPGHKLRALQSGAKDFVSKPFDMLEVRTRIHNLLEVRLLHQRLANLNHALELQVRERTAELRESEARYRALTELATDWYWEQDSEGRFTKVSGPVLEMLGMRVDPLVDEPTTVPADGWDPIQRAALQARISARTPFLDVLLQHNQSDGTARRYRVSGTPMFDGSCNFIGYRGFGVEILP
ncbi:response regulator [Hydrogenophaga sp. PBL-H3]|uniref:response regulator n=1 Tax=Hydrogenophaga sp. PBL-H3 TaxID=434010 RepID=UPI00131FF67B|nr:response regulator [Hydrogenophaga sp. PBL-H3]QHE77352.1 response regulator [Hydrogenophaga sp. PBL-H3]QHE81776.1 response regulator [Hydrogenophaga sp. PBL-H3]